MTYDNWKTTNPADAELGNQPQKHKRPERRIVTIYWAKPIPTDQYDWEAMEDGYDQGDPVGYGKTEQEAVDDLNDKLDDRDEENEAQEEQRYYAEMDATASREDAS